MPSPSTRGRGQGSGGGINGEWLSWDWLSWCCRVVIISLANVSGGALHICTDARLPCWAAGPANIAADGGATDIVGALTRIVTRVPAAARGALISTGGARSSSADIILSAVVTLAARVSIETAVAAGR